MKSIKFDWDDVSIIPEPLSNISTRSDINSNYPDGMLPIFISPMDTVIDDKNAGIFFDNGINICLPRGINNLSNGNYFISYGLDEIERLLDNDTLLPKRILIDIANGHMKKLYDISHKIKKRFGNDVTLMIGNIANPKTYEMYCNMGVCVDYIRVGIGGGSACTTSANTGVHYPMASLVMECREIADRYNIRPMIVADGGFKNFSDITKALALGADYVMLGGIFSKCFESCSDFYIYNKTLDCYEHIDNDTAIDIYKNKSTTLYKHYRGMSTKDVQRSWNKVTLKTSEGIQKFNAVEYTLGGWVDNFNHYLKTIMSYCSKNNLSDFIGNVEYVMITNRAFDRFNK